MYISHSTGRRYPSCVSRGLLTGLSVLYKPSRYFKVYFMLSSSQSAHTQQCSHPPPTAASVPPSPLYCTGSFPLVSNLSCLLIFLSSLPRASSSERPRPLRSDEGVQQRSPGGGEDHRPEGADAPGREGPGRRFQLVRRGSTGNL